MYIHICITWYRWIVWCFISVQEITAAYTYFIVIGYYFVDLKFITIICVIQKKRRAEIKMNEMSIPNPQCDSINFTCSSF